MKKLLFAIVGAAAFSAFAADPDPSQDWRQGDIDVLGFENFDLTNPNVTGAVINRDDTGVEGTSKWSCSGDDASLVKTYGSEDVTAPNIKEPDLFASQNGGDNYLALDTNGSELQRAIPAAGQAIAADGTYIDTLIQFTPSESAPTDLNGAKIAIWLGVENNVTNLCVQGACYTLVEGQFNFTTPQKYTLSGTYEPGTWYRMTIKAVSSLLNGMEGQYLPGFVISVDGQTLTTVESAADAAAYSYLTSTIGEGAEAFTPVSGANKDLLDDKQFIPSLAVSAMDIAPTLTAVGFKGTGALDDFVVTTAAPDFTPAAIDFQLTWPAGFTGVKYKIGDGEWVDITGISPLKIGNVGAGTNVQFVVQNADGAQKTLNANGEENGIDATGTTFGWPEYLGAALAGGEYGIDNANELLLFKKGVEAGLSTANATFKLTTNIDATSVSPWDGISTYNSSANAFVGTLDGAGFAISNLMFAVEKYRGFFDQLEGTVKNLTIDVANFADTSATEHGYAAFAGNTKNATFINCVASGVIGTTAKPAMHTCGGFVVKVSSNTSFTACTNHVNIVCALTDNPKIGGIVGLAQGAALTNCWNDGNMTITVAKCDNDGNGAGGLLGLTQTSANTISGGGNAGIIQSGSDNPSGTKAIRLGSLVASPASAVAVSGGTVAQADMKPTGANFDKVTGASYATVAGNVATFVADTELAAGNTYKVMVPNLTPTYVFAAPGTIAFDEALNVPASYAITASGLLAAPTSAKSGDVTTYTVGYFPRTATAGQNGTAANPFEIADVDDLQALQAAVDADASYRSLSYVQTANIDMASAGAFAGIGTYDEATPLGGKSFSGTYDGQDYKIANVTMTARTYGGIFNQVGGGTIKNLAVENIALASDATKGGFAIVGNFGGNGALLQNLTALGSFGSSSKPGFHNMAGIVVRACGGGADGSLVKDCTNNATIFGTYTKLGGVCTITQHKIDGAAITFDGCVNNGTLTMPSGDTAGRDGLAGIVGYVSENTKLQNCLNAGTMSSTLQKAKIGELIGWAQGQSLADLGDNMASAEARMIGDFAFVYEYVTNSVSPLQVDTNRVRLACATTGFQFSTVADNKATTTSTLVKDGSYLLQREVWANETPFTFQEAGTIAFDTKFYPFNGTITAAEGLTLTDATSGTVKTYTAAAPQPAYPTYVGEDATLKTQYDTWKATNGADSQSAFEKQFLLNVASGTTVADDALVIESITENATAGWDIVVSTTVSGAALSDGSSTTYNGYLLVKAANDLAGLATATPVAYPVTAVTGGKVSITVTAGKFMKVVLTTTAPAQN